MIKFLQDNFDSKIFKKPVYKLWLDSKVNESSLRKMINRVKPKAKMIFAFTNFIRENLVVLNKLGFRLISIRNTYHYNGLSKGLIKPLPKGLRLITADQWPKLSPSSISTIADIIGQTGRYYNDKKIPKAQAKLVYQNWLNNSLFNGYADYYFGLANGQDLAGLITLKIKNNQGFIDLIGVSKKFQGLGLGSLLVNKSVEYLTKKKVSDIYVITENENVLASAFYQKQNFILEKMEAVYHKL